MSGEQQSGRYDGQAHNDGARPDQPSGDAVYAVRHPPSMTAGAAPTTPELTRRQSPHRVPLSLS
jgi:hypothetical protein